jgi:hypothetical protein
VILALWIVTVFAALGFLGTGSLKAFVPKPRLRAMGLAWTDDFAAPVITLLGVAELVGAVGLIAPLATRILPLLSPIGAISVHVRRKENFAPALVMLVVSIASAVLGFVVLLG